jgi:hypothetical protein
MLKIAAPTKCLGIKKLELVVESQTIFNFDPYVPYLTSIPKNSNLVLAEERTHSRARKQPSTHVPVQNIDENEE